MGQRMLTIKYIVTIKYDTGMTHSVRAESLPFVKKIVEQLDSSQIIEIRIQKNATQG